MARIHQQESGCDLAREVRAGERCELDCRFPAATRIPVAGQIDEMKRGGAAAGHAIYVCEPGLAGRGAGTSDAGPDKRVEQARFPDIRPPHQGDLRETAESQLAGTWR